MQPEHTSVHYDEQPAVHPVSIPWNGQDFLLIAPPHRTYKIVRTKVVPPHKRREYNLAGWPRHLVLMREHSLRLPGDDLTLKIVTNADEAEDEFPEQILTPNRDIGTYRDATIIWRGRPVRAFVSARLTASGVCPAHHPATPVAPVPSPAPAEGPAATALASGLVLPPQGLLQAMTPEERKLSNYLISRGEDGDIHSLVKIGSFYGVSDETIRRRKLHLEKKYPPLRAIFAAFRSRNTKGLAVPPMTVFGSSPAQPETDHNEE